MFKKGDKAVVISVDRSDISEGIRVGETVIITDGNSILHRCIRENGDVWPFYGYQLELAEAPKKYKSTPKTETQPMAVNISIGAELTNITIGGKRFRLVSED